MALDRDSHRIPKLALAILGLLLAVHFGLALGFARVTPYRTSGFVLGQPAKDIGAPDERQHANYVQSLLSGNGVPVFNPRDPNLYESYQSHQPPLYYALAAAFARGMAVQDMSQPEGVRVRWLNALISLTAVLGCFCLGLWGFGSWRTGLAGAAVMGLLPMFVALGGAISNDPLLIALCTWSLAVMCRGAREGWTNSRLLALGALCGLAMLTKTSAVVLLPTMALALVVSVRRPSLYQCLLPFAVAAGMAAPWWIRNVLVLGPTYRFDPLAIKAFNDAFAGSPQASAMIEAFGAYDYWLNFVGWWTARSFFGAFGYMDVFLSPTAYRLMLASAVLLAAGALLGLRRRTDPGQIPSRWICLCFAVLVALTFVSFNLRYFQGQARYLFPALAVVACVLGRGALELFRGRWALAVLALGLSLAALDVYVLSWLPDQFARRM